MNTERYEAVGPTREDLRLCRDCSTRATGVVIPVDEIPDHDDWHRQTDGDAS